MDFGAPYGFAGTQQYPPFLSGPPLLAPLPRAYAPSDDNADPVPDIFDGVAAGDFDLDFELDFNLDPNANDSQHPLGFPYQPQLRPRAGSISSIPPTGSVEPAAEELSVWPRGSDEEDSHVSASQTRRREQNRVAQRAFRERKELHVRRLEAKLVTLEAAQQQSSSENTQLMHDLQHMATENEILRATSTAAAIAHHHPPTLAPCSLPLTTGPQRYKPSDFYVRALGIPMPMPAHRLVAGDHGQRLLDPAATWNFIVTHELYQGRGISIADVGSRLRAYVRCDGQGPVFAEWDIVEAIRGCVAGGSDDLLR